MFDITALGELLIDFSPCGSSATGMKMLEMNPGGAVANVLCAASKLGLDTAFIGKVGADAHGSYLRSKLNEYRINTAGLTSTDQAHTTLAFVDIDGNGERSFSFMRDPGADTLLTAEELPDDILKSTRIFHVGSLSMTAEPSRSATLAAIECARAAGAVITYDPNYRAMLWSSQEEAVTRMRSLLPMVDMIKLSDDETCLLTGEADPEEAIRLLLEGGIKCAVVTAGEKGSFVGVKNRVLHVKGFRCRPLDTTGAGDAFWGAFLTSYLRSGIGLDSLTAEQAAQFAVFGNAAAAFCVCGRGAMPAMPEEEQVWLVMKNNCT